MMTKVLDKNTALAKIIMMLFREQGIMIASSLVAIGKAIGVLIEMLLPSGGNDSNQSSDKWDDKLENMEEWSRNKLKALELLLGELVAKMVEALPGIIGVIIISDDYQ